MNSVHPSKTLLAVPFLLIAVGVGWLLTAHNFVSGVNWIWILGLGVIGLLIMGIGGIDKVTIVVGPYLIVATFFSLLRQTGRIGADTEVPALVIAAGVLMLISRLSPVPIPPWLVDPPKGPK